MKNIKYGHRITLVFGVLFAFLTTLHLINDNNLNSSLTINTSPSEALRDIGLKNEDLIVQHFSKHRSEYCFITRCENLKTVVNKENETTYSIEWASASNRANKDERYFEKKLKKYFDKRISEQIKSLLIIKRAELTKDRKALGLNEVKLEGFNRAHKLTGEETPLLHIATKLEMIEGNLKDLQRKLNFHISNNHEHSKEAAQLRQQIAKLINDKKETIKPLLSDSNLHILVAEKDELILKIRALKDSIKRAEVEIVKLETTNIEVEISHTIE